MSALPKTSLELQIAECVVRRLAPDTVRLLCEAEGVIAFRVQKRGWKLSRIVFSQDSLRHLANDPQQSLKLDYLVRDIERVASSSPSYLFPYRLRLHRWRAERRASA